MLLKRFRDNPELKKTDRKLVLDPDLIDLTMIPPPMTPDEVVYLSGQLGSFRQRGGFCTLYFGYNLMLKQV